MATKHLETIPQAVARIKQARERLGLSRTAAARKAKISPQYWSMVESGERIPSWDRLQRIARAVGIRFRILEQRA